MNRYTSIGGIEKSVIESITTSGLSPDEILSKLDSFDIQWYLSEGGKLYIRYWQLCAEDFVPPEQIGEIRNHQQIPREAAALEWLSNQLSAIKEMYVNRWIAIDNEAVFADAENLPTLLEMINNAGVENPFITFIPPDPIIWNTAYGQQNL